MQQRTAERVMTVRLLWEEVSSKLTGFYQVHGKSGKLARESRTVVGCWGLQLTPPEFGNIVHGVFTPVLANRSLSALLRSAET